MQTEPNLSDPDGFYERLIEAHAGLDDDESTALDARLILLLANQVGDAAVLTECIAAARESVLRARRPATDAPDRKE
jgi:hypothetical protein